MIVARSATVTVYWGQCRQSQAPGWVLIITCYMTEECISWRTSGSYACSCSSAYVICMTWSNPLSTRLYINHFNNNSSEGEHLCSFEAWLDHRSIEMTPFAKWKTGGHHTMISRHDIQCNHECTAFTMMHSFGVLRWTALLLAPRMYTSTALVQLHAIVDWQTADARWGSG